MTKKVQITLEYKQNLSAAVKKRFPDVEDFRILAKSLDARGAPRGRKPKFHYTIEVIESGEQFPKVLSIERSSKSLSKRPVIIGAGPAGLFCALRLLDRGIISDIYERGDSTKTRMKNIAKFWRYGKLDPDTNVCFGEGGAGLYSDGKLITRIKSEHIKYVMEQFVRFGAPADTAYMANPHLGSNKIRDIITAMSSHLKASGCGIFYNARVEKVKFIQNQAVGIKTLDGREIESDHIVLASGHSAREMYEELHSNDVAMKAKSFAIGVRIEHSRRLIDKLQHGEFCIERELGAARYRLSFHASDTDKGTYSFCMCPGGYVLSSGSHEDGIVTNGMSNSAQNSPWSNAALVVAIDCEKDIAGESPLRGLHYLEDIERKAYEISKNSATGKELPAITVGEFLNGRLDSRELAKTSCPSKLIKADITEILPKFVCDHIKKALYEFDKKIPGFLNKDALLIAPETRTSAPITILRDSNSLESSSHAGLYPAGEGAGYAGGITSAAVDGVRVAEAILSQ